MSFYILFLSLFVFFSFIASVVGCRCLCILLSSLRLSLWLPLSLCSSLSSVSASPLSLCLTSALRCICISFCVSLSFFFSHFVFRLSVSLPLFSVSFSVFYSFFLFCSVFACVSVWQCICISFHVCCSLKPSYLVCFFCLCLLVCSSFGFYRMQQQNKQMNLSLFCPLYKLVSSCCLSGLVRLVAAAARCCCGYTRNHTNAIYIYILICRYRTKRAGIDSKRYFGIESDIRIYHRWLGVRAI